MSRRIHVTSGILVAWGFALGVALFTGRLVCYAAGNDAIIATGSQHKHESYAGTVFNWVDLSNCVFEDCDFTGTTFNDCKLQNVVFRRCNLTNAKFELPSLHGASLPDCIINGMIAHITPEQFEETRSFKQRQLQSDGLRFSQ